MVAWWDQKDALLDQQKVALLEQQKDALLAQKMQFHQQFVRHSAIQRWDDVWELLMKRALAVSNGLMVAQYSAWNE